MKTSKRFLWGIALSISGLSAAFLTLHYIMAVVFEVLPPLPTDSWIIFFLTWGLIILAFAFVRLVFLQIRNNLELQAKVNQWVYSSTKNWLRITISLSLLVAIVFTVAIVSGSRHDYTLYENHWFSILSGENPWGEAFDQTSNAYGPLYNPLSALYGFHPLAPKLFFCFVWLAASTFLVNAYRQQHTKDYVGQFLLICFLYLNPFFWLTTVEYGLMEVLPAACCLGALVFRQNRKLFLCGFVLALGALLKYYPIVLLPFLMLDGRHLRIKPALSCIATIAIGLYLSILIWGMSTLNPVFFAGDRTSKILSIFRFLRGRLSPLKLFTNNPNLDAYSVYVMAFFVFIVLILAWFYRLEVSLASVVCMQTTLAFYKVGHLQLYTVLFFLVPFWYLVSKLSDHQKNKILIALGSLLMWITAMTIAYNISGRLSVVWGILRESSGLLTFGLSFWGIFTAFRYGGGRLNYSMPSQERRVVARIK